MPSASHRVTSADPRSGAAPAKVRAKLFGFPTVVGKVLEERLQALCGAMPVAIIADVHSRVQRADDFVQLEFASLDCLNARAVAVARVCR